MRRGVVLLAGALAIGGGAAVMHGGDAPARAEIQGAPLQPSAQEIATFQGLAAPATAAATAAAITATTTATPAHAVATGKLDLDHILRVGDHFEAPLGDGRTAVLTLDPTLQQLAEKLLDESRAPKGAIVAMAPDGRILALAGRRTAEPKGSREGTFDWRLATDVWAPAASVFKLVTASALVAAGTGPDDKVCFHGGVRSVSDSNLRDDKRDSRCETLMFGVAHSNNAILGKLAYQKLDPAALVDTAQQLGIAGALPGTELVGTAGAITIPTSRDLDFAKTAAGFSSPGAGSQLSVAGGALLAATFADDGEQPIPHLIASVDGVAVPAPAKRRALSVEQARAVARMMVGTCDSGSASKSFGKHRDRKVAGKTGTLATTKPFYMEHSWFVGFAPAESAADHRLGAARQRRELAPARPRSRPPDDRSRARSCHPA